MQVIIPMAGFGKRLRPHTHTRPKPLINVAGKPVLGHVLDSFAGLRISELLCITGYLGEQIEGYVRNNYNIPARFFVQEELNGQSPAVFLCRDYLSGPALVVFVDTIIQANLLQLEEETADAVALVKEVSDPRRFGVAELGSDGWVTQLVEKPESLDNNLAVVGFYYVKDSRDLIRAIDLQMSQEIQTRGEYYLTDAFNIMIQCGARMRVEKVDVWEDCGKPETVLQTNRYLLDHGHDNSAEVAQASCIVVPPVHVDPSARITHAVIGPHVTIASHCHIEDAVIIDSIIDEGATVRNALLRGSLIGRDAWVMDHFHSFNVGDSSSIGRDLMD